MSTTIDDYKLRGLTLINTSQRYIDTDSIRNEIASIGKNLIYIYFIDLLFVYLDKSWCEYVEYILDTIDYIQLHQEDLHEFSELANHLLTLLNEKQMYLETINDDELKSFHDEIEKHCEQIELLNQKGELLLPNSETDSNENEVERLLEAINRNYDNLIIKTKARLDNINKIHQTTPAKTDDVRTIE